MTGRKKDEKKEQKNIGNETKITEEEKEEDEREGK